MREGFFNFLLIAIVSFAIGILTYLIGRDSLGLENGSMAAAGFAGVASGVATDLGFEIGMNDWSKRKVNIIAGMIGSVVGGGLAAMIGIG